MVSCLPDGRHDVALVAFQKPNLKVGESSPKTIQKYPKAMFEIFQWYIRSLLRFFRLPSVNQSNPQAGRVWLVEAIFGVSCGLHVTSGGSRKLKGTGANGKNRIYMDLYI